MSTHPDRSYALFFIANKPAKLGPQRASKARFP